MKVINKLYMIALGVLSFTFVACEAGVEYEYASEEMYSNVSLTDALCIVKSRGQFELYGVNWKKWKEEVLETTISTYSAADSKYTNTTTATVDILGTPVAPGETVNVRNKMTEEDYASAPDGKLYVLNVFVSSKFNYKTKNNGWVFDASKIASNAKLVKNAKGEDLAPGVTQSEYAQYPVDKTKLVVSMVLSSELQCSIYPQNDAPTLGTPADYSQPRQYMVENTTRRPDGVPQAKRLYEIRIIVLP